jgi:hypothetical protein
MAHRETGVRRTPKPGLDAHFSKIGGEGKPLVNLKRGMLSFQRTWRRITQERLTMRIFREILRL